MKGGIAKILFGVAALPRPQERGVPVTERQPIESTRQASGAGAFLYHYTLGFGLGVAGLAGGGMRLAAWTIAGFWFVWLLLVVGVHKWLSRPVEPS